MFCVFKQKTAYEMRISDWSSDVCSSDLLGSAVGTLGLLARCFRVRFAQHHRADHGREQQHGNNFKGKQKFIEQHLAKIFHQSDLALSEIGRASCRERVCQYVWISVVAVSLKKNINNNSDDSLYTK